MSHTSKKPEKHRMKRERRLVNQRHWISTYKGKNIIKGYCKFFHVDKLCAIKELSILGVEISEERKKQVIDSYYRQLEQRRKQKEERENIENNTNHFDNEFSFIAGYTSGGAPYGIRWDEQECEDENLNEFNDELPW
jgi:hypothetical protein